MKGGMMTREQADKLKKKIEAKKPEPTKAREAINALHGSPEQRAEETKTLSLTFAPRQRPDVVFTGQWSGRLVKAAFNAISKAYRHRRYKQIRPGRNENIRSENKNEKGGKGDGNA